MNRKILMANSKISGAQTQIAIQAFYSRAFATAAAPAVRSGEQQEKISEVAKSIHF
jgi:hypothetical protein